MTYELIVRDFEKSLEKISSSDETVYIKSMSIIHLSKSCLRTLKAKVLENGFETIESEIFFFKKIKTIPLSNLIYFKLILNFESNCPITSASLLKKFIKKKLNYTQRFFNRHVDFSEYLKLKQIHLDEIYFTRYREESFTVLYNTIHIEDLNFNTPKDVLSAQFTAYFMYIEYLKKKMFRTCEVAKESNLEKHHLKWTGNKIDLIELIYALQASGRIQGGSSEIKQVANACEELFQIDLGNYYRKYLEIKSRKIERTKFLDNLKANLIQRMEAADA